LAQPGTGRLLKRAPTPWRDEQNYLDFFAAEGISIIHLDTLNREAALNFSLAEWQIMFSVYDTFPHSGLNLIVALDNLEGGAGYGTNGIAIGIPSLRDPNGPYARLHESYLDAFEYTFAHEMAHLWGSNTLAGKEAGREYERLFWTATILWFSFILPYNPTEPTAYGKTSAGEGFAETLATCGWGSPGSLDSGHRGFIEQWVPFLHC
jgi:hypothetical protein